MLRRFLIRWLVSSLGLWVAAGLLSGRVSLAGGIATAIIAGLLLALINMVIRPVLVVLSLPLLLVTLGLFMLVINGLTVYLVSAIYPPLHFTHFWVAIVTGVIIGLVNYLISVILERNDDHL